MQTLKEYVENRRQIMLDYMSLGLKKQGNVNEALISLLLDFAGVAYTQGVIDVQKYLIEKEFTG